MSNIALNKYADANSSVFPFRPGKSVNGYATPIYRWLGSSPISSEGISDANWLRVDLGSIVWINRWVVKQMGSLGWSEDYNLANYKLQGSLDSTSWFDLDSVTDNSLNITDRAFKATKVRWVRVYITKGLRNNTNIASISELEIYDTTATDSTLSALSVSDATSAITLNPSFGKTTTSYTASVGYDTAAVLVTPTVSDPDATVTVNGVSVVSGQASPPVSLAAGAVTAIRIVVTPVLGATQTYTINVTRASSPYLSNLTLRYGMSSVALNPAFAKNILNYNATIATGATNVNVTATIEVSGAAIRINNSSVVSGQPFNVLLTESVNDIKIEVTPGIGTDIKTYHITVTKQ